MLGLLAMMYIAAQPAGVLAYRREIAAHYNIPAEFLAKVLQKLSRQGLIRSFRGTRGGYTLAREADTITLVDVVEAVDGPMSIADCQRERCVCPQEMTCTVQTTLVEVQREIRQVLAKVSLGAMRRRMRQAREPRLIALEGARAER